MGLNPREKSERQFDGSKQIIPGNGIKTVIKNKNPFQDIIKDINDTIGIWPTPPPTPEPTSTPAPTPSVTPTQSVTPTVTPTSSVTPTITPTNSVTPTITPTSSLTPTITPTQTKTPTPTQTQTKTPTPTQTSSKTPTPTPTPTSTPNCFCYGFTNTGSVTQKVQVKDCRNNIVAIYIPYLEAASECIRPNQYTAITADVSVTIVGPCQEPSVPCNFFPTPTPTTSPSRTPVYTVTPTITSTPTPTNTPTRTITPTVTKTSTPTLTITPTITSTPTVTRTTTPTTTPTPTVTPSRVSLIGPYFKFANIAGRTTNLAITSSTGATFDIRWGDGTFINAVPSAATDTAVTYSKTYGGTVFTGSGDNFRTSNVPSVNKIKTLSFEGVSQIENNQYTFSAFSAVTVIRVANSTIPSFDYSLPTTLDTLQLQSVTGSTKVTFNPIFTNRSVFRVLNIMSTNIEEFNFPLTGGTQQQTISLFNNDNLKSINTSFSPTLRVLNIQYNNVLTGLTFFSGLTASTLLTNLLVTDNPILNGWTYDLPATTLTAILTQNAFTSFNIDLSPNTVLSSLLLFGNQSITSFTNTVSACTSLLTLRLDKNKLKSLPPVFPNSLRTFFFSDNLITGYTSNIPTNLRILDGSAEISNGHVINTWDVDLTGATLLESFNLNNVELNSWVKNFPTSIRTVTFKSNNLSGFDINLVSGATTLDLSFNPLSRLLNLSLNNTISTLILSSTNLSAPNPFIVSSTAPNNGNLPSSLLKLYLANLPMTNWNLSFASAASLYYLTFKSTPLTQASVDFILYDLRYNSSVDDGQLFLDGANGPATPSAAGIINRDYLINTRGWLINTN